MTIRTVTCALVECDTCGTSCWKDCEDKIFIPHFATVEDARKTLTDWLFTATGDLCTSCAQKATCERLGHEWTPWRQCSFMRIERCIERRDCARCDGEETRDQAVHSAHEHLPGGVDG